MNKEAFNNKYMEKGGFQKLYEMKDNLCTLQNIANHFGVCRDRVRQLMIEIFNEKYDPRIARRNKKINMLVEYMKDNGIDNTKQTFKTIGDYYMKMAIKYYKFFPIKSTNIELSK